MSHFIPVNGHVTEVVVTVGLSQTAITVNGVASVHTTMIDSVRVDTLPVEGRVLVLTMPSPMLDPGDRDFVAELGERIQEHGGVAVIALPYGWEANATTVADLRKMLDTL